MAGTNNFLQFNPSKTNQSTDINYQNSSYRSGGIPSVPSAAPSTIHNKLYYQVSIMAVAIAQMLANRNYDVSDATLSDLINVLDTLADKNTVLPLSGGTMTGHIVLPGNPTVDKQAAPKQYVDTRLPLAGGTLTGPLLLARQPQVLMEAATKQYVDNIQIVPIGAIFWFARATAPSGYVIANGQLLSRTAYANLWTEAQNFLVSDATWNTGYYGYYSSGNGSSTFRVPSLVDRTAIGGGGNFPIGSAGGEITHRLTVAEIPSHNHFNHPPSSVTDVGGGKCTEGSIEQEAGIYWYTENTGGDQPHNNMQPYTSLLPCIKI